MGCRLWQVQRFPSEAILKCQSVLPGGLHAPCAEAGVAGVEHPFQSQRMDC